MFGQTGLYGLRSVDSVVGLQSRACYLDRMLYRFMMLLGLVLLAGCASEKRMGESRIQARRHTKGIHIQHHREPVSLQSRFVRAEEERVTSSPDAPMVALSTPEDQALASEDWPVQTERRGFSVLPVEQKTPQQLEVRKAKLKPRPSSDVSTGTSTIVRAQFETLPDPVDGRHPNAVPGFVLSLGWLLGIVAEGAITYLQIPLSGLAFALGFAASIVGYFLSRKSFRMSREHPELYPRFKLSRAARWVSAAVFAPVALYAALLVILLLLLGGL